MNATMVLMVVILIALFIAVTVSLIDDVKDPMEIKQTPLVCDRAKCRHTDCKYHALNKKEGHAVYTDLMWSMGCPYYTYTEDIDDPEG